MLLHMWDAQGSFPFQHVPAVLGGGAVQNRQML